MGLLGPSWSWDEIQKKDAIMGELKKENDRILDEQRKMIRKNIDSLEVDNYRETGNGFMGGIVGVILLCCIPLAFIMVKFLLSQVELGNTSDPISMEITIMFVGSLIANILSLIVSFKIKDGKVVSIAGVIFIITFLLGYFGVLIYDIFFNGAFDSFWKILQFILGAVLTIFTSGLWALVTTIIGTIIVLILSFSVGSIYNVIKMKKKKQRILNSGLYQETLKMLKNREKEVHYLTISSIDIEIVTESITKINFEKKGYSSLDKNGIIALGLLLKKELSNYKMRVDENLVVLRNDDYDKKQKQLEKQIKQEEQAEMKRKKQEKKDKIKSGKDW